MFRRRRRRPEPRSPLESVAREMLMYIRACAPSDISREEPPLQDDYDDELEFLYNHYYYLMGPQPPPPAPLPASGSSPAAAEPEAEGAAAPQSKMETASNPQSQTADATDPKSKAETGEDPQSQIESATDPKSKAETGEDPQSKIENDVNNALASQLAGTSVTPPPSDQLGEMDTSGSSSTQPSVIVSDLPEESVRQPPTRPQVIVRDIVDLGNGQSVVLPNEADVQALDDRTGHKRKAGEEDDNTESAPSPKEPRTAEEDEESDDRARQKEEAVQQVMKTITEQISDAVTPNVEQQIRALSRDTLQYILDHFTDAVEWHRSGHTHRYPGYQGRRRRRAQDEDSLSDEDLDEALVESASRLPSKFTLTNEQRLTRLLVFGGTSSARPGELDPEKSGLAKCIRDMIANGEGEKVVGVLRDINARGRSFRQNNLLFVLATCCRTEDRKTKTAAYTSIRDIIRIPTHLFQLVTYIESFGDTSGWGRGLRKAIRDWYNKSASNPLFLAMHITKYWNRHGWTHRDIFRLCHIKPVNDSIGFIVRYAVKGMKEAEEEFLEDGYMERPDLEKVHKYLKAVEETKTCQDVDRTVELVQQHNLVREQLATQMLNEPRIWSVLLPGMPLMALLRNLNKMTAIDLFSDPDKVHLVLSKLMNTTAMRKAKIHPLRLLLTHRMYQRGSGDRGSLTWKPVAEIVAGLEKAFYASFDAVETTNKRILIALDISGSMSTPLADLPITMREAATVMAMVTIRREPHCDVVGFHDRLMPLEMFKDTSKSLGQLAHETSMLGFGSTDCSAPMIWAKKHRKEYDAFLIYTDSETNFNRIPPYTALDRYRARMNLPNTKMVVVGMASRGFTIARPEDLHMLDVVGFDPETPEMIREFLTGGVE